MVSSRYRRRVPITSRTKPFKKGVSPTLQIRQEYEEAERNREKDYQKRRRELTKRIDARIKQLEEYNSRLSKVETKPRGKKVTTEELKDNVERNKEEVLSKKTYKDESGKTVKIDKTSVQIKNKTIGTVQPKKVVDNPGTWVKIDFDGNNTDKYNSWKLKDIKATMKQLIKEEKAVTADPSEIRDTTGGKNVYKYADTGKELWASATIIYDIDKDELWAKNEETTKGNIKFTEKQLSDLAVSEDGFAEDF
tara:strand:- start:174 stop:923 length:750 start_codon:yes stop_codon:yes gene_type:complete